MLPEEDKAGTGTARSPRTLRRGAAAVAGVDEDGGLLSADSGLRVDIIIRF